MTPEPLILVIDDEEAMRDACAQILLRMGCRVETAADGAAGLEKCRELRPDAVILDLKMPGLGGLEVLDGIGHLDPRIVVVVITGYATVDAAVEAMKRGAYDFLPKPFTPEELRLILARALERRYLAIEAETLRLEKKLLEENVITMVSHQLRSPLAAIQQYFEVLLSGIAGNLEEKPREMIRKASDRLTGLRHLINDWLDLARIDKTALAGKSQPVDLPPILTRLADFMDPLAREYDVTLEVIRPPESSAATLGDADMLEQVFSNLLTNAILYNKPKGRVWIRFREDKGDIVVDVEDTGIGIAAEHLPLIFDQFYRVRRSEGAKTKGTGLGLAIAKKIVEAHGGRIEVSSAPGQGTTFSVRFPKVRPAEAVD